MSPARLRVALGIFVIALAVVFLWVRSTPAPDFAPASSAYVAVDRFVAASFPAMRIPGMAFGLVHDDQAVNLQAYGEAGSGGHAVTTETRFVIGSTSKSFTALAIMQLVEAGRIDLDAPVQKYLPWFTVADSRAAAAITVRQLLNHTSGLSTRTGNQMLVQRAPSIEQAVRNLASAQLTARPGAIWQYSNANYEVLGAVIEAVSRQAYGDYIEQHIFAPLDMKRSYVPRAGAAQDDLAGGYRLWFGIPVKQPVDLRPEFAPAGYLVSTAQDLTHYLVAQMNGGRYCAPRCRNDGLSILSPAGIAAMQAAAVPQGGLSAGQSYGMGWMQVVANEEPVIYHEGDTLNQYALLLMIPRLHYGIVLLANGQSVLYFILKPELLMALNVARLLDGRPPAISYDRAYLVFDLAVLALLVVQGWILYRLLRSPAPKPGRSVLKRVVLPGLLVLLDLALVAIALLAMPTILDTSWANLWRVDVGLFLLLYGFAHLVTAGARVWRQVRPAAAEPVMAAAAQ